MAVVGSPSTRLVILRGDSASGKTTTALAVRPRLSEHTALIHQDVVRREMLSGPDRSVHAAVLIDDLARRALDLGYDVILDGIFNLRDYADRFERLWRDHLGRTAIAQFDIPLEETLRRHSGRPLATEFGENEMRAWYDGWQPLPFLDGLRIRVDESTDQIVERILAELDAD